MRKLSIILLAIFIMAQTYSQIDRSIRPEPGAAPRIEIGKAESFTLDNGLQVFVVENTKIPRVTFSLVFDYPPVFEGPFAGLVSITGQMLRTATGKRTKEMIDDEIDFIGASMTATSRGVFASGLTRHAEVITELISDVIINAKFEDEHFNRIMTQTKSSLSYERNDPSSIASRINNVLLYGPDHPYGVNTTTESLENISLEMCRQFHQTFIRPEVTYMAIVGDVKFGEIKALVEKYFYYWEKGNIPSMDYPTPQPPEGTRVAIFDRPNAVQSNIRVSFPVELMHNSDELISARVMNSILGGGTSRLFYNLRETHGYTYGAYSRLSPDRYIGSFTAFTDVRNSVTDSAVHEILHEISRLQNEPVSPDELQLYKNELSGNFALSLESPQTVANFAINTARYQLPDDYYTTYLQRLEAITAEDILETSQKFLFPDNANILVIGKASEVEESLQRFAAGGQILYYDEDGIAYDPNQLLRPAPEGITADMITENYILAIGGKEKLSSVNDLTIHAVTEMQGMELNFNTYHKAPNKFKMEIGSGDNIFSTQIFDGEKGLVNSPMGKEEITGEMLEELKMQSVLNLELSYDQYGVNQELSGIETIAGKDAWKIIITYPSGNTATHYYDVESGLRIKSVGSSGTVEYSEYREAEGILFPFALKQAAGSQIFELKIVSIKVNTGLKDEIFRIE